MPRELVKEVDVLVGNFLHKKLLFLDFNSSASLIMFVVVISVCSVFQSLG